MTISRNGSSALEFNEIPGGITAPKGFTASGIYCGIRKVKKDIALIKSDVPADVAAVFTLNKVVAAPLVVDKLILGTPSPSRERGQGVRCSAIIVKQWERKCCHRRTRHGRCVDDGSHRSQIAWHFRERSARLFHRRHRTVFADGKYRCGHSNSFLHCFPLMEAWTPPKPS